MTPPGVNYCHFQRVVFVDGVIGILRPFVSYLCIGGCRALRGQQLGVGGSPTEIFQPIDPAKWDGSPLSFPRSAFTVGRDELG